MPDLKRISKDAIPRAIQKAERYRLLNQSWATESICLDVLEIDPANQQVLVMLLLSLTDQFGAEPGELTRRAHALLSRLTDPYQQFYYAGIIAERLGHANIAVTLDIYSKVRPALDLDAAERVARELFAN